MGYQQNESGQWKITDDDKFKRLAAAVAALATDADRLADECQLAGVKIESRMSMEEQIERLLYPEHFQWTTVPEGGVW